MADKQIRYLFRKKETSGSTLPSDAMIGEPFVNTFEGRMFFRGTPGGTYLLTTEQSDVFEVGGTIGYSNILSGINVNNKFIVNGISGTTLTVNGDTSLGSVSATTIFLGSTNLYDIFATSISGNTPTKIQSGLNTYTGGTETHPSVNISSMTLNTLIVSGETFLNTISAITVSATTFYGDGSQLSGINSTNTFTTGATLSGYTSVFSRNDGVEYNLDLTVLKTTSLAFSAITNTPTTLFGYGIIDSYTTGQTNSLLNNKFDKTGGTINGSVSATTFYGDGSNLTGVLTASQIEDINNIPVVQDYSKELTGFVAPEDVVVNYSTTARTITLTGTVTALWRSNTVAELVSGWVSDPHPTGKTTNQYLYYNGSNFIWSDNVWEFSMIQIAVAVYYGAAVGFCGQRECHGLQQWQCHFQDHMNEGTWLLSGGVSRGITFNSTNASLRRPTIDELTLMDEDLKTINPAITTLRYPHHWLTGSTTATTNNYTIDNLDIVPLNGNIPYYNPLTVGSYTLTPLPNNGYMSVWRVDIPCSSDTESQKMRSIFVVGQTANIGGNTTSNATALAAQLALDPSTINLGTLATPEYRIGWQYVIRYSNLNWTVVGEQAISGSKQKPVQIQGIAGLTSVAHDDTLTGAGTIGNPLSVVDNTIIGSYILPSASWTASSQSIYVSGVTTTNEIWWDASTLADNILAGQANLFCSTQATDSLTFQCATTPASDINIKVTIR